MTKHYLLLFITIIVISCSHKTHKSSSTYTADTLYEVFVKTVLDQDATWQDMADLAYPLADSICEYAANENSFEKRMYAQDWGYMVIGLLSDKYDELEEAGKEVNEADLSKLFGKLTDAMSLWFYTEDEQQPYIWRDHYYNSYQNSDNPKSGFFYLTVTTPSKDKPKPSLLILYPNTAEDYPTQVFFTKYKEGNRFEENQDSRVLVQLEDS